MTRNSRRRFVFMLFVAGAALAVGSGDARAQYGMGGFGFMGMGMRTVPSPSESINQLSLVQAQRATMGPVSNNVYANNPNSYINRVRDNGFVPHYSLNSRRSPGLGTSGRRAANSSQASDNPTQPEAPTIARPVVPIGSFFNDARKLVWPSDAPVTGDLIVKRDISDQSCLVVAELVEKFKSAPITTVTEARQKLLDYGQPALQDIRSRTTSRIADAFHMFLLSLYDSLAQAAEPPVSIATSNPAP